MVNSILTHEPTIFTKFEVSYSFDSQAEQIGYRRYDYEWRHIPSKIKGLRTIYVRNKGNLLLLLNNWQTKNWVYHLPIATI